jgi:protein-S-isoprenylcysteine O-methyltransferase Ste14
MSPVIKIGLQISWIIFGIYWLYAARNAKRLTHSESFIKRFFFYWFPIVVAVYLLGPGEWFGHTWLRENFVPHSDLVGFIGLGLVLTGLLLCCWSRFLLGRNWSATVQLKKDHELITAGPYGLIRHPIYTGLLLMFSGNGLIVGDYRAILAVLIVFISFWRKLRLEEKWLEEYFGTPYDRYMQHTKALLPGLL